MTGMKFNHKFFPVAMSIILSGICGCRHQTITPRVMMDDHALIRQQHYIKTPTLASGWENRGNAFFRPLRKTPAGIARYRVGLALPDGVSATIEFLDSDLQVIHSVAVPAGKDSFVAGKFMQHGNLEAVRIVPSQPTFGDALNFSRPFQLSIAWALDEPFTCLVPPQLPVGWQGKSAEIYPMPWQKRDRSKASYDAEKIDNVLRIKPMGFVKPEVDAALLTENFAFEFAARIDENTVFSVGGIELRKLYAFTNGIWYRFRLESDRGKVTLKLNGRKIAENLKLRDFIIKNLSGKAELLMDDFAAFALETPDDYVPAPQIPAGRKYEVGMNVCSLWRTGTHWGWRCIDQVNDREPVLGYYDEGLPETADWEIKYMVEAGITFQAYCWYPETNNGPIRHPRFADHLNNGFKNARYSDLMKYCLIWEIVSGGSPHTLEAWRKNYVPYLIEHHFKDPRYLILDGHPVMAVFSENELFLCDKHSFGSTENTRKAFAMLDAELAKIGLKSVIWVETHKYPKEVKDMGFTATCSYNHGYFGYQLKTAIDKNEMRAKALPGLMPIPTASVGYDVLPWHGVRVPMMTPGDFRTSMLWGRDEFLPKYAKKGSWQERLFWLSTWNEYGEGTYVMPVKNELGFAYLDAIRSVFTTDKTEPRHHVVPTQAQQDRIGNLYPRIGEKHVRSMR